MMSFNDMLRFRRRMNRLFNEFDHSFEAPFFRSPFIDQSANQLMDWDHIPSIDGYDGWNWDTPLLTAPQQTTSQSTSQPSTTTTAMTVNPSAPSQPQSQSQSQSLTPSTSSPMGGVMDLFRSEQPGWLREIKPIRADIIENEKDFTVKADVPGFSKNELKINFDANSRVLTIKGHRNECRDECSDSSDMKDDAKKATDKSADKSADKSKNESKNSKDSKDLKDSKDEKHTAGQSKSDEKKVASSQPSTQSKPQYYRRYERAFGEVSRSFKLPPNIDASKITAKHESGVLTLIIPKKPLPDTQQQNIQIN